ncbi:MAG: hypothetical protein WA432_00660 [Candidatus Babeliaceae bacterium]
MIPTNRTKSHCCELMDIFLEDPNMPLKYYPIAREYGFLINASLAIQLLNYCPWCSIKLTRKRS